MCGIIDDCGPDACRNGNCVDKVKCYTFDCDEDCELTLQVNGSVPGQGMWIFLSNTVQWSRRECERESVMMLWQL